MNYVYVSARSVNKNRRYKRKKAIFSQKKYEERLKTEKNYYTEVKFSNQDLTTLESQFQSQKLGKIRYRLELAVVHGDPTSRSLILNERNPFLTELLHKFLAEKKKLNAWRNASAAGGHLSGAGYDKACRESKRDFEQQNRFYAFSDSKPISSPKKHSGSGVGDLYDKRLLSLRQNEPLYYPNINIRDNKRVLKEEENIKIPPLVPPGEEGYSFSEKIQGGFSKNDPKNHQKTEDELFNYVFKTYQAYRQTLDHHRMMSLSSNADQSYSEWKKAKERHGDKFPNREKWEAILLIWTTSGDWSNENEGGRWMSQFFNFMAKDKFKYQPTFIREDLENEPILQELKPPMRVKGKKDNSQYDFKEGNNTPSQQQRRFSRREKKEVAIAPNFQNFIGSMDQEDVKNSIKPIKYENINIETITQHAINRDLPSLKDNSKDIMSAGENDPVKRAFLKYQKRMENQNNE